MDGEERVQSAVLLLRLAVTVLPRRVSSKSTFMWRYDFVQKFWLHSLPDLLDDHPQLFVLLLRDTWQEVNPIKVMARLLCLQACGLLTGTHFYFCIDSMIKNSIIQRS